MEQLGKVNADNVNDPRSVFGQESEIVSISGTDGVEMESNGEGEPNTGHALESSDGAQTLRRVINSPVTQEAAEVKVEPSKPKVQINPEEMSKINSNSPQNNTDKTLIEKCQVIHNSTGTENREGTEAGSQEVLYCFCKQPWDKDNIRFMIQCDSCKNWYHGSCVDLKEENSKDILKYHCPVCVPEVGPSISKDETHRNIKAGSTVFLEKLKEKEFTSCEGIILKMSGSELTIPKLHKDGFSKPILVEKADGLRLRVPPTPFGVRDVEHYVGSDYEVDVIDVRRQTDIRMTLKDFCDYFTSQNREKLYNLISLEFSKTGLSQLVQAPWVARVLDMVQFWPKDTTDGESMPMEPPTVSKYCLVSAKDSFTDFHIDFGGTSVWYHVLWGEKVFYLVEPTKINLALYESWMTSTTQYETFFADMVDFCYCVKLKPGQTLFIPTGWIHGVLTPEDSLVFGGNFLHNLNIGLQLEVYNIERNLKVPDKYLFPYFETTHWYGAQGFLQLYKSLLQKNLPLPDHIRDSARDLLRTLKTWTGEKSKARELIPRHLNPIYIISRLGKLIRKYDAHFRGKTKNSGEENSVDKAVEPGVTPYAPIKIKIRKVSGTSSSGDSSLASPLSFSYEIGNDSLWLSTPSPSVTDETSKLLLESEDARADSNTHSNFKADQESDESVLQIDEDKNGKSRDGKKKSHKHRHHHHRRHKHHKSKSHKHKDKDSVKNGHSHSVVSSREEGKALNSVLVGTLTGMEELLRNSNYNERLVESINNASSSMKDAINEIIKNENKPLCKRLEERKRKPAASISDLLKPVHQDDDYCYYSILGGSSDDDAGPSLAHLSKRQRKKLERADEWSPSVKVGEVGKRENSSNRAHARVPGIEKGIEAAAASLEKQKERAASSAASGSTYKTKFIRKLSGQMNHVMPSQAKKRGRPPGSTANQQDEPKKPKPKKGLATPKQRLGKILKLGRLR